MPRDPGARIVASRVGRRMLLLFVLCALVPTLAVAVTCFVYARRGLEAETDARLRETANVLGQVVVGRTLLLAGWLNHVAADGDLTAATPFRSIHRVARGERFVPDPANDAAAWARLDAGKPVLFTRLAEAPGPPRVYLAARGDTGDAARAGSALVGEIGPAAVWDTLQQALPVDSELIVHDGERALYSSVPQADALIRDPARTRFTQDGVAYRVARWTVHLWPAIGSPDLTIVVCEPRDQAPGPAPVFSRIVPLVLVVSICVVVLLSATQIRRSLVPLDRLRQATQRISRNQFGTRVDVMSQDEFGELATAFNEMAARVDAQFQDLEQFGWQTLEVLARAIDAKSPWTAGHSHRVTRLGVALGRRLGLTPAELEVLQRGGLLHDVGKIGVPAEVLDKPGRLTDEELAVMREHPVIGARIIEPLSRFAETVAVVRHHHEHWDGNGYPDRLSGTAIPISARIFAVADVYDALVSDRPYRPAWSRERVLALIRDGAGKQFDPQIVEVLLALEAEGELDMHAPVEDARCLTTA